MPPWNTESPVSALRRESRRRVPATSGAPPPGVAESVMEQYPFYVWDEGTGEVRWMCSWDTTADEVDGFVAAIAAAVAG